MHPLSSPSDTNTISIPPIRAQVLGGGCDVGRSCIVTTFDGDDNVRVMFDCGAHPGLGDATRFPDFVAIPAIESISCGLITHFHLDHAAALPYLTETLGINLPVYMTPPTKELCRIMLYDFLSTSLARNQFCPYDEQDILNCLRKVLPIHLETPISISTPSGDSELQITAHYAGHVLGAVMYSVESQHHRVLYSGDYSTGADRHLKGVRLAPYTRPHLFMTETTYCSTTRKGGRRQQEELLMEAISGAIQEEGRVLIAVPALGRAQELCEILSAHWKAYRLDDTPVYMSEGLASRASTIYQRFRSEWCMESDNTADSDNANFSSIPIRPFNRVEHWHIVESRHSLPPCILFATPGSLSTGLSLDVFREWCGDPRNLVVMPGFCFANTIVQEETTNLEIRCRIHNMTFSSHTDADGIKKVIEMVQPDSVLLMHGDESKIKRFKKDLSKQLRIPVYAPKAGDALDIPVIDPSKRPWSNNIKAYEPVQAGGDSSSCSSEDTSASNEKNSTLESYLNGSHLCVDGFTGLGFNDQKVCDVTAVIEEMNKDSDFDAIDGSDESGEHEYRYKKVVSVTIMEDEATVIVEWGSPKHTPTARELLRRIEIGIDSKAKG